MKRFLYISLCVMAAVISGCEGGSYSYNSNAHIAQLSAFAFAKNDSMPGLSAAVFSVEERIDTGLVWNKDSMLYGTRLDSVVPRMTYVVTPSAAWITTPDTVCQLTGYDTLNFTKTPIYLTIRSSDQTNTKTYEIRATVHQQDPDLYTWETLSEGFYAANSDEQRTLEMGDAFVMLSSNGATVRAYRSFDGAAWTELGEANGLPAEARIRQVIGDGERLYYGEGNTMYTSTDAVHWTGMNVDYPIVSMLLFWNARVWALIDNEGYQFAYWHNGALDTVALRPDGDFPVRDFASVCFESSSLRERAMLIGGIDKDGAALDTRWCLEYSTHPTAQQGMYRLQDFSAGRHNFSETTGASAIWYKNQLLLFGTENDIMVSTDEGLNWTKADSTKNMLPEKARGRKKQTVIVRDKNIYLFGGQDADNTTYGDVYRGRLNSIDWKN